jgi:exodeoxyribonuclease VII large subunit
MEKPIRPSSLGNRIQKIISSNFDNEIFWMTAEIINVKKYPEKKICYLMLVEKDVKSRTTEFRASFWPSGYDSIETFEKVAGQQFKTGLEITCKVKVKFHTQYGLTLEITEIDQTLSRMLNIHNSTD